MPDAKISDLDWLREQVGKMTPPPWETRRIGEHPKYTPEAEVYAPCPCCGHVADTLFMDDAKVIALLRNLTDALIDVARSVKEVKDYRGRLEGLNDRLDIMYAKFVALNARIAELRKEEKNG